MVSGQSRREAAMLAFIFGFSTIQAEQLPEGVMPKRQVAAGTGGTTSATPSTTAQQPSSTPVTSDSVTSKTPNSPSTSATPVSTTKGDTTKGDTTNAGSTTSDGTTKDTTTSQTANGNGNSQQPSSTSIPTTVAITTTNAQGHTVTSHISTNTLAAATTKDSHIQTSTNSKGENIVKVGSKTINPSTLSHKTTIRQPLVTHETKHSTFTSFWTSDGQRYSSVYTTDVVHASTTGFATATIAPGLANGGGSGDNLSTNTKKIIGGVVGGIGGAILIGGLAFVAWRLWGRKKAASDGQDDLYNDSQTDSIANQKRQSTGVLSSSAYSDTNNANAGLERYQNPNGAINTSSNF